MKLDPPRLKSSGNPARTRAPIAAARPGAPVGRDEARLLGAAIALVFVGCSPTSSLAPPANHGDAVAADFQRVPSGWHEDFTLLDPTVWHARNAGKKVLDGWNDPALAFARSGLLHVGAETRNGRYYTTQLMHRDLVKRGTVTAAVRCPQAGGWWAAVWLQTDNTFLRGGLEVDLWECHRNMGDHALHAVHEYDTTGHLAFVEHSVPASADAWHVVSVTLEPNKPIRFTLDGAETVSPYVWPPNPAPVRVIVSGHVGPWAGAPDTTAWPDFALVDWIAYTRK